MHDKTNNLYNCKHCQKSFSNRKIFERHVKIHKNVKYKCIICEKATSARKDNIRRHIKHLHSEIEKSQISKYVTEYQASLNQGTAFEIIDDINKTPPAEQTAEKSTYVGVTIEVSQEESPLPQQPAVFNNRVNVIQSIGNPNKNQALLEDSTVTKKHSASLIHQVEVLPEKNEVEKEIEIKLPPKKNPIALGLENAQTAQTKPKYDRIELYRKILLGTSHDQAEEVHGIPTQIHWRKRASQNFLCHQ